MRPAEITNTESPTLSHRRAQDFTYPLPTDHLLLHLISQDVCRGLAINKSLLRLDGRFINALSVLPLRHDIVTPCGLLGVFRPADHQTIPPWLQPTQLQMNSPHATWIDALPFPGLRDILIRRQRYFNHIHFLEDLIGDIVHTVPVYETGRGGNTRSSTTQVDAHISPNGNGLILWGEPYLKESWEVTPHFLSRWTWLAEGCAELVSVSNRRRTARGEDPLDLACTSEEE